MIKNYLTVAIRSLWRNKSVSAINIAGLSIGLACCMLIFLYSKDEWTYDRFHTEKDHIYRVTAQMINAKGTEEFKTGKSATWKICSAGTKPCTPVNSSAPRHSKRHSPPIGFPTVLCSNMVTAGSSKIFRAAPASSTPAAWTGSSPMNSIFQKKRLFVATLYNGMVEGGDRMDFMVNVTVENNQLMIESPNGGLPKRPVTPIANNRFLLKIINVEFVFVADKTGRITTLLVHINGQEQVVPKGPLAALPPNSVYSAI
jgi:hypothetical protein